MRDGKGRFTKYKDDGRKVYFLLPSIKSIAYWIFIFVIFLPWIAIGSKFHLLNNLFNLMDELMLKNEEDSPKKNGLFY